MVTVAVLFARADSVYNTPSFFARWLVDLANRCAVKS